MKKKGIKRRAIILAITLCIVITSMGLVRIHFINESNSFKISDFNKSVDDIFGIIRCKKICDKYEIEAEIDEVYELKENYEKFLDQADFDGCDTRDLAKVIYINNFLEVDDEEKYINKLKKECYNEYIGIFETWAYKEYEEENLNSIKVVDENKVADTIYIYEMFYGTELEEEILEDLKIYEGLVRIYEETENMDIKGKIFAGMYNFNICENINYFDLKDRYINYYEKDKASFNVDASIYSMSYYLSRNDWKLYEQLGIDCSEFKEAARTWTFEGINKNEWQYNGNTKNESMLLLSGLYMDEVGIEDSIFLIEEFANAYGLIVTDYSNDHLKENFNALCEEYLDKQVLFGI